MASSVAVLGPFVGGLNQASDASAIADNELAECVNLNVDLDGSLVCRTPFLQVPHQVLASSPGSALYGRIRVIGTAQLDRPYLLICGDNGVGAGYIAKNDEGIEYLEYTIISNGLKSDCAIQLHNIVYFLARPDSTKSGMYWDGTTVYFEPDPDAAPRGSSMIFYKDRVWVTPGADDTRQPQSSQLKFSDPVPLTTPVLIPWNAVNLIPVGQGDGEKLIDLIVSGDNILLFKNNSTYAYIYDVSPNEGILRSINNDIGTSAQFCVVSHENEIYTFHEGIVYQIANYTFTPTSLKVPFRTDTGYTNVFGSKVSTSNYAAPVSLSLLGNTLVVRYFEHIYALNLITRTWSEWKSSDANLNSVGRFLKLDGNNITSDVEAYYGGSALSSNGTIIKIKPLHTSTDEECVITGENTVMEPWTRAPVAIQCSMTTKIYDFATPHMFKRLMWWGVDLISDGHVIGIANPVRQTLPTTWGALAEYTWDQLFTWDDLLSTATYVETDVNDPYVIRRKFIKLLKSLRFRRIAFIVKFESKGETSPEQTLGPARLFTISAIVGIKQTVVKQVS